MEVVPEPATDPPPILLRHKLWDYIVGQYWVCITPQGIEIWEIEDHRLCLHSDVHLQDVVYRTHRTDLH